jgi:aerobic-type carbon monoxide dehydrogenase small subunit (CoxS/CutS family)
MPETQIEVNGTQHLVQAAPDTPLLYVLRNELGLHGPKFGCGLAQCGVCSVLVDGQEARSCVLPLSAVSGHSIVTIEGLPAAYAKEAGRELKGASELHPLQKAWIEEQVPQCGYCQSGMMIQAASLLRSKPNPSIEEIKQGMDGHLCRCGTYFRIIRAVQRAAASMQAASLPQMGG